MDPEVSRRAMETIRKREEKAYERLGLSVDKYRQEIVTGALLPWRDVKAKSFALTCFREEMGLKPSEKLEVDHKGNVTFIVKDYAGKPRTDKKAKRQAKEEPGNGKGE